MVHNLIANGATQKVKYQYVFRCSCVNGVIPISFASFFCDMIDCVLVFFLNQKYKLTAFDENVRILFHERTIDLICERNINKYIKMLSL